MVDDGIDDIQHHVEKLLQTPVGRRWLLKAGFGAAAAALVPGGLAWAGNRPQPSGRRHHRSCERRVLHFALGAAAGLDDLRVIVDGEAVALTSHTKSTRCSLRSRGSLWRKLDTAELTHFAAVRLPSDRGTLLSVLGNRAGQTVVVAQSFQAPAHAVRVLAKLAFRAERTYTSVSGSAARLATLGLDAAQLTSVQEIVDLYSIVDSYQTAVALTMLHPNVATKDSLAVQTTNALLGQTPEVSTLGSYIGQMQQSGQDYATQVPVVDADGQPSQIKIGNTTTTFSTVRLNQTDPTFVATAKSAFVAGIQAVRDTDNLGTVLEQPLDASPPDTSTWHQPEGIVVTPTPYTPPSGVEAGVSVNVQNTGMVHGIKTVSGTLSGNQLPLTLYNNYVRWVWVYVQYLQADGTNLSLSDAPTWPDTHYAQSLGLLPQIFTVLGIPLWDTNTINVTLDFPAEATAARLLFCGLGNGAVDGGWRLAAVFPGRRLSRSYRPTGRGAVRLADHRYPDHWAVRLRAADRPRHRHHLGGDQEHPRGSGRGLRGSPRQLDQRFRQPHRGREFRDAGGGRRRHLRGHCQ